MQQLLEQARAIKLLICDLDGVLTDGYLYYGDDQTHLKAFHVQDGFGLKLLMHSGVEVGVITTSKTPIVTRRMENLSIPHVYQGQYSKTNAYEGLLTKLQLDDSQVAYIGDDLPDLPLIKRVSLGVAVANANTLVREQADWVTKSHGGRGAVREVCDLIMQAQNTLTQALQRYETKTA